MAEVEHQESNSRWVARVSGADELASLSYELQDKASPQILDLRHTFTPPSMRGKGVAGAMVRAAFEYAREKGMKVQPTCSYIPVWVKRNPDFADLVASPAL